MKTNCWLILGTMLATSVVAQVNNNTNLPPIPQPAAAAPAAAPVVTPAETATTNAPAKHVAKSKKKAVKKAKPSAKEAVKKASESISALVTLVPGPATVDAENVNLRGQAGLQGEVIGHVKKGDTVTVISEITVDKPKAGEPSQWAKIALPSDIKVWVDAKYIDAANNTVKAKKLNLRGGPGENYSVLGVIESGTSVSTVSTKGTWMQIQPPANAFAFLAASYLKQEAGATPAAVPPVPTVAENVPPPAPQPQPMPPTQATISEAAPIAPPSALPPATPALVPPPAPEISNVTPSAPAPVPVLPVPQPTLASDEDTNLPPPPPRVVTHEGYVRHAVSVVAPTYFELFDPENNKAIDYLYTTSTNLNLARYDGMHITATGEEAMDVRWKDTPVLTIQKIYVLPSQVKGNPAVVKPIHPHK